MDVPALKAYFDNICSQFEFLKEEILKKDIEIGELRTELGIRRKANETLVTQMNDKEKQVEALKRDISRLQEDNAAFSKVSHIIAMEKENSKLRSEVEMLTKRLSRSRPPPQITESEHTLPGNLPNLCLNTSVWCMESVVSVPVQETVTVPDTYIKVPDTQTEEEETFYEKRIKGVDYYISEMTSYIYKKEEDDEVGEKVGRIEKTEGNKTKVVWNKEGNLGPP